MLHLVGCQTVDTMFTDVEASQTSVTVTVGPPMYEGPLDMAVHVGKAAAAWNAVLRVLGDLEWPCRLYILLPRYSDDDNDEKVSREPDLPRGSSIKHLKAWDSALHGAAAHAGVQGDLHPLVLTAWRCLLRAIDHLLTCEQLTDCCQLSVMFCSSQHAQPCWSS